MSTMQLTEKRWVLSQVHEHICWRAQFLAQTSSLQSRKQLSYLLGAEFRSKRRSQEAVVSMRNHSEKLMLSCRLEPVGLELGLVVSSMPINEAWAENLFTLHCHVYEQSQTIVFLKDRERQTVLYRCVVYATLCFSGGLPPYNKFGQQTLNESWGPTTLRRNCPPKLDPSLA